MKIMSMEFAPLNGLLQRRLQTLAIATELLLVIAAFNLAPILLLLLCFTALGWLPLIYLVWMLLFDRKTPEQGGRRNEWISNWKLFKYAREYFPVTLVVDPELTLDSTRNYLFCSFPHGILSKGLLYTIMTNTKRLRKFFPNHKPNIITLPINFKIPIYRDYVLALGACSSSEKSITYLLKYPGGGRIAVLVVGGAEEVFYACPGSYQLVLKNRKGFVKLALKNGSPLVPIFCFGENDVYRQVIYPKGSRLRRFQEWIKARIGLTPVIAYGRGILQYSFGFLPLRKPIYVVVGRAIEVEQNENPTENDIEQLHAVFINELTALFEKYKNQFIENAEDHHLEII